MISEFWFGHPKCHFWYPQNGSNGSRQGRSSGPTVRRAWSALLVRSFPTSTHLPGGPASYSRTWEKVSFWWVEPKARVTVSAFISVPNFLDQCFLAPSRESNVKENGGSKGFHLIPVISPPSIIILASHNSHLVIHKGGSGAVEAPGKGGEGSPGFLPSVTHNQHCLAAPCASPHSPSGHDKVLYYMVKNQNCRRPIVWPIKTCARKGTKPKKTELAQSGLPILRKVQKTNWKFWFSGDWFFQVGFGVFSLNWAHSFCIFSVPFLHKFW